MNLVRRVDEVKHHTTGHQQAYGEHGTLKTEPLKIQLKDDAQPYAIHTASTISHLPMLQKFKDELQRMENNGVIERVTQPTDWCAPMVLVRKKNTSKARICVDLKKLNESVERERYILPTSDEITTKLSGATVSPLSMLPVSLLMPAAMDWKVCCSSSRIRSGNQWHIVPGVSQKRKHIMLR